MASGPSAPTARYGFRGPWGVSDMFWINMQAHYDAEVAREQLAAELASIDRIG